MYTKPYSIYLRGTIRLRRKLEFHFPASLSAALYLEVLPPKGLEPMLWVHPLKPPHWGFGVEGFWGLNPKP